MRDSTLFGSRVTAVVPVKDGLRLEGSGSMHLAISWGHLPHEGLALRHNHDGPYDGRGRFRSMCLQMEWAAYDRRC